MAARSTRGPGRNLNSFQVALPRIPVSGSSAVRSTQPAVRLICQHREFGGDGGIVASRPGMQLRCCARRTGSSSSTHSAKTRKTPGGSKAGGIVASRPGMQLRCCARRTGSSSSTHSAGKRKGPTRGPFHFLAERVGLTCACGAASPTGSFAAALVEQGTHPQPHSARKQNGPTRGPFDFLAERVSAHIVSTKVQGSPPIPLFI